VWVCVGVWMITLVADDRDMRYQGYATKEREMFNNMMEERRRLIQIFL